MKLYRIGIHEKKLSFTTSKENPTIYKGKHKLIDVKCKIDSCDYKNTLKIFLEEEIPIGIYVVNNQYILFSQDLIILDIVNNII